MESSEIEDSISDDEKDEQQTFVDENTDQYVDDEIVLCVIWKGGKLGAAVYFMESCEIHVLQDVADIRPDFPICKQIFQEIRPTTVITCPSISILFVDFVKSIINKINETDREEENGNQKIKLNFFSSINFQYDLCKRRVLDMKLVNPPVHLLLENRETYLYSLINFDYTMTISATGALLFFLDKSISKICLQKPSQYITDIKIMNLEDLVWIDRESYTALEIFSSNSNFSGFKWTEGEMKESFSIYGLFNRCISNMGSQHMRILLSHPTKDIDELRKRHQVIDFFLKAENNIVLKNVQESLKNICNISHIIAQIMGTQASPSQWKTFYKTVYYALVIGEICFTHKENVSFFEELSGCLNDSLYAIINVITHIMDFEASQEHGRFVIKEGSISELDEVREKQKKLPQIMEEVAAKELIKLPEEIQSCTIVYLPEIGYLLAVPIWRENLTSEEMVLPNAVVKFVLNDVIHYKTAYCSEMDEALGDSHLLLMRHETEIMYQTAKFIGNNLAALSKLLDKIKQLDCLLSFSDVAKEFDLIEPDMVSENFIHITNGRHMLQKLCVDTFVPNDFHSSSSDTLVKIFTSPNASGKSVYLKQNALIVYLAHIGSYVPAEKATIGVMDYIHTRMQTTESISTQLSSFMLDLRQMYSCLFNSSPRTLIMIDEFGKGTADIDGLALLSACVQDFLDRGSNCPHILISTHYHSLLSLIPSSPLVKLQTMEFLIEKEEIVYLYKVKDGSVNQSFALNAGVNVGFSNDIIHRSGKILDAIQNEQTPEADLNNLILLMTERRKNCLKSILRNSKQTNQDLEDIISALNDVRY